MNLLLSPHNDDEALFAAYIALREKPKVIVALDGALKRHSPRPAERAAESAAAMEILGCEFEHLGFPIERETLDWDQVDARLRQENPEHVWAPMPEPNGHRHHNRVAAAALDIWGADRVSFYSTYRCEPNGWPIRTDHGFPVDGDADLKRRALDCYVSQIESDGTRMHFERPYTEYEASSIRLNLGGALNPIHGYVNIGKETGWLFEDGLDVYPDGSVEAITESHALMYVSIDQWPAIFAEFHRVLRPGGFIRLTHDNIGGAGSRRPVIRPGAALATTPELLLDHLAAAGFTARIVDPDETGFVDDTLIQQNYGQPPDIFHTEGIKWPL